MTAWKVVFEVRVLGAISEWPKLNRIELDAIQTLLREGGPEAVGWSAMERLGHSSWEGLTELYKAVYWTAFDRRFYRLTLEVRPGRTVIVRHAACGVYQRRPPGR